MFTLPNLLILIQLRLLIGKLKCDSFLKNVSNKNGIFDDEISGDEFSDDEISGSLEMALKAMVTM